MNIRIVSVTNEDLQRAIKERCFRQDLFYRLQGYVITALRCVTARRTSCRWPDSFGRLPTGNYNELSKVSTVPHGKPCFFTHGQAMCVS